MFSIQIIDLTISSLFYILVFFYWKWLLVLCYFWNFYLFFIHIYILLLFYLLKWLELMWIRQLFINASDARLKWEKQYINNHFYSYFIVSILLSELYCFILLFELCLFTTRIRIKHILWLSSWNSLLHLSFYFFYLLFIIHLLFKFLLLFLTRCTW